MIQNFIEKISGLTVLCVGDVMLDEYVYGDVRRLSPEAAAPVLSVTSREKIIGGAANVGKNIAALGARCRLVGVIGNDKDGQDLYNMVHREPNMASYLLMDDRPTTIKTRFVSNRHHAHIMRADTETTKPIGNWGHLLQIVEEILPDCHCVVLSDYAKGVLTERVAKTIIAAARERGLPIIVDPKNGDIGRFVGATVIKPNESEAIALEKYKGIANAVLVTLGERGIDLYEGDRFVTRAVGRSVKVVDVSGAGDTVCAVMAVMISAGASLIEATEAANAAAAIVVGKPGTSFCSAQELLNAPAVK